MSVRRTVPWVLLLVAIIVISNATVVHAQTTFITGLTYPNTVLLRDSSNVPVSFTVTFSAESNGLLFVFVWDEATHTYADGSVANSSPVTCIQATSYTWAAACGFRISSLSGSESVTFNVDLKAGSHALDAAGVLADSSADVIWSSLTKTPLTVTVRSTITLNVVSPSGATVSVDGASQGSATSLSLNLNPGTHVIVVPSLVNLTSGSRLRFDHWSDGSTDTTRSIDLENDTSLQAVYVAQYSLTLVSSQGNMNGVSWYDSGSSAAFSISSTYPMTGILGDLGGRWVFNGWYERQSVSSASPDGSITMDAPHTLTASWVANYTQPGLILAISIGALLVVVFWIMHRRRETEIEAPDIERVSRETTVSSQVASSPEPRSMLHCSQCGAAIPRGNRFCAECGAKPAVQAEEPKATADKTTMFRTQCGAVIPRNSKFCTECGTKVSE